MTIPARQPRFSGAFKPTDCFPIPDLKQWEDLAIASLNAESLQKLESLLPEDLRTHVLYATENSRKMNPGIPGAPPYLRGRSKENPGWLSCPLIDQAGPEDAGKAAAFAVGRDAGALWLQFADPWSREDQDSGIILHSVSDFQRILGEIDLTQTEIHLDGGADGIRSALAFIASCQQENIPLETLRGSFGLDPLGALAQNNALPGGVEAQFDSIAAMMSWSHKTCPMIKTLSLSTLPFSQAGASTVEELGILLAEAVETFRRLEKLGASPEETAQSFIVRVAIGRDFFTGIAKLRALRALWFHLAGHCQLHETNPPPIHAVTAWRSLSRRDPWVNLLRQTVEAFAAIVGGADLLTTRAFDSLLREPGDLGQRIALNTQTILREECHLDRITDPGGGSWYIEELSRQFAEASWGYFQKIESHGGFVKALRDGQIQRDLGKRSTEMKHRIATRKMPVTGVSTWAKIENEIPPNRKPRKLETPENIVFDLRHIGDPDGIPKALGLISENLEQVGYRDNDQEYVTPLRKMREAEDFEALQDRAAGLNQRGCNTDFLLLKLGPNSETTERERFVVNFFAAGGIRSQSSGGFDTVEECLAALKSSGYQNVCIIGADARYPEVLPDLSSSLRREGCRRIFVAGRPREYEAQWRSAGVDAFIHIGIDVLDFLGALLEDPAVQS